MKQPLKPFTASSLIEALQAAIAEHGDLELRFPMFCSKSLPANSVSPRMMDAKGRVHPQGKTPIFLISKEKA